MQPSSKTNVWSCVFEEDVKWKKKLFMLMLPSKNVGKGYINKCTRLILEWVNDSQLQSFTIKTLMIMSSLLLQKIIKNAKAKYHTESLKQRRIKR